MNKKQLLSIAMLLSIASTHTMSMSEFEAEGARATAQAAAKVAKACAYAGPIGRFAPSYFCRQADAELAQQEATAYANAGTFGKIWMNAKAAPFVAYNAIKSGSGKVWDGVKAAPGVVKTGASDLYTFAKANPTTFGVRTGAVAGAGYVAYRNVGNVYNGIKSGSGKVWNKIKENPKTVAALVTAGALGYYKGDAALAAAKAAFAQLPATPESVTNAVNAAYSYVPSVSTPAFVTNAIAQLPATPEFVTTATNTIANNPYTSAAYAAVAAQGVADYVGLAGSQDDKETATETVKAARNGNLFYVTKDSVVFLTPNTQQLSTADLRVKLQETKKYFIDVNKPYFASAIDAKLAELA